MSEYKIARGKTRTNLYRRAELQYVDVAAPKDAMKAALSKSAVDGPDVLVEVLQPFYGARTTEHFGVVGLSSSNKVVGHYIAATGGDSTAYVSPAEVARFLVLSGSRAFVLFHNHPSGSLEWTTEDLKVTQRFRVMGALLSIRLLDHILFTPGGQWSSMQASAPSMLEDSP